MTTTPWHRPGTFFNLFFLLCPAAWERCRCHRGSWRARWCQQQEQDGGGTPASPASGPHPERASGHSPSTRQAARRWKHCRGIKIKQQPPSTFYTSFFYYFLTQPHLSAQTQRHDSVLCTRSMVTNKLEQPFKKNPAGCFSPGMGVLPGWGWRWGGGKQRSLQPRRFQQGNTGRDFCRG